MSKNFYFKYLKFENFKSLNGLEINDIRRINIFSGENGIGKSTLLESIFFILDRRSHISLVRSAQWRNIDFNAIGGVKSFFNFISNEKIAKIECEIVNHNILEFTLEAKTPELTEKFAFQEKFEPQGKINYFSTKSRENNSFIIRWKLNNIEEDVYSIFQRIDGYDIRQLKQGTSYIPKSTIISPFTRNIVNDTAQKFSNAFKLYGKSEIINDLRLIRPDIRNIELLFENSAPVLYAEVEEKMNVPLSSLGDGIRTLINIILSFMTARDGIVLLDEFESAIYYKTLPKVWQLIERYSEKYNVQVFCVTHSYECIKCAYEGISNKNNLSFYRLEKFKNSLRSIHYNPKELKSSFATGWEIR